MGKIHLLRDDVKNKIAAGEVVERPASVVKELIENSIDANASEIEIIVSGGGNASIQVVDDGEGLDKEDLALAFERHATSRLRNADDLQHIGTLGFRGEALASIASVARVKAISATDRSGSGNELVITDGEASRVMPASIARGTSITVSDLFFSVPARRKFLKSPRVELRHIIRMLRRFALAYPEIGFNLVSDGRQILSVTTETLEERIGSIFDPTYRKNILPVRFEKEPFRVEGFVGKLNLVRKRSRDQFLFLNRRYITNNLLNSAVYAAYQSLISRGEFPFFVLNLSMPADQVDVNVHPVKIEVRFRDEWRVYHVVKSSVSRAVADVFETIPDFRPAVDQTGLQKGSWFGQKGIAFERPAGAPPRRSMDNQDVERAKDYVKSFTSQELDQQVVDLENIWQVHNKYIVSQIKSGLVIIDQHVAHERILFEQGMEAVGKQPMPSQTLLFPQVVEFPADDFSVFQDLMPYLCKIGFRLKEFGKNTMLVEGVPSEMVWGNERQILREVVDDYQAHHREYATFQEAVAASFACRAAVKAGDALTKEEMQSLVDRLFATKHPYYCPHGRPILISLSLDELDKRFERS